MSDQTITEVEAPKLNPVQRLVNIFIAPSKTFEDVRRSSGWWVPFIVVCAVGLLYSFVVIHKVGLPTLVDETIRQSSRSQDQMANATPEQAAKIRSITGSWIRGALYSGPVLGFIIGMLTSGVLLATANFGAGGRAKFKSMLGVWFYGTLPLAVFYLLVIVAIYAGVAGESFNLKNPIGTNIGFYLIGGDLPKAIIPVLSAIDIFAIWTAVLLTIGVSTVAQIKRGAAAAVVFGWWIVFILLQTAGAMVGG